MDAIDPVVDDINHVVDAAAKLDLSSAVRAEREQVVTIPASTAATTRALGRARENGTLQERDGSLFIGDAPVVVSQASIDAMRAAQERRDRRAAKRSR